MCGIAGIISLDESIIAKTHQAHLLTLLDHRGPDDRGVFFTEKVLFGHTRLSIIDLSSNGHQPFKSADGQFVIVYNGEIYNYIELRQELAQWFTFSTNTDTEVLLNAFIKWGSGCLDRLNGMFAFAVYDLATGNTFIARDRYGVKPLYLYKDSHFLYFSSEIPSLLSILPKSNTVGVNKQAVFDYLAFNRTDQTQSTFFDNITRLDHGSVLEISKNNCSVTKWYNLEEKVGSPFRSKNEFLETFRSAIEIRMRSDVEIGVCLSGGLDSSAIVAVMLNLIKVDKLKTFTATYEDYAKVDESRFARMLAAKNVEMRFTSPNANTLLSDLDVFCALQGEPVPSTSPYSQFKVMELANTNAVVLLDGQGADEMLGGYHYLFGYYYLELLRKGRWFEAVRQIISQIIATGSSDALLSMLYFSLSAGAMAMIRSVNTGYIQGDFVKEFRGSNQITSNLYDSATLNASLLNHFEYKLEHLLKWEDRNSMFFGLESRLPFLDYRLVEGTLGTPSNYKIDKGITKNILRQVMSGLVPKEIIERRDKKGFATPQDEWFRSKGFRAYINENVLVEDSNLSPYVDIEKARSLYKQHLTGNKNIAKDIWKWINLSIWLDQHRNFLSA